MSRPEPIGGALGISDVEFECLDLVQHEIHGWAAGAGGSMEQEAREIPRATLDEKALHQNLVVAI